jgi:hypothetical protein
MFSKITVLTAALLAAGITLASPTFAEGTPRLDQRQQNQAARIRQGVASGELTRAETRRLVNGQQHVRRLERRAKADGEVTLQERARLEHAADVQSGRIYRQKHDAQDRH